MKKLTITSIAIVAALMVATGIASASTMKADVPFAFRTSGVMLEPGTYKVALNPTTGVTTMRIMNAETGKSILALTGLDGAHGPNMMGAKLVFDCSTGRCSLVQVWTDSKSVYTLPHPKLGKDADRYLTEIPLRQEKGD